MNKKLNELLKEIPEEWFELTEEQMQAIYEEYIERFGEPKKRKIG